jgi:hypothetical protein
MPLQLHAGYDMYHSRQRNLHTSVEDIVQTYHLIVFDDPSMVHSKVFRTRLGVTGVTATGLEGIRSLLISIGRFSWSSAALRVCERASATHDGI